MPKYAPKQADKVDLLVVGSHPSAFLTAALLKEKSKLRVVHVSLETTGDKDRLVTINPLVFDLHPLLAGLAKKVSTQAVHGLQFLSDQADTRSEHRTKAAMVRVGRYSDFVREIEKISDAQGVEMLGTQPVSIQQVDENGLEVMVGKHQLNPTALILAGDLPTDQKAILGIPDSWGPDVVHRFTTIRCKAGKHVEPSGRQLMPMSLDLCGKLCWGWLMHGEGEFQLAVEQPVEIANARSGFDLLSHWVKVLQSHGLVGAKFEPTMAASNTIDLPLAGALAQEGVANRTLLIGPAGGSTRLVVKRFIPAAGRGSSLPR